MSKIDFYAEGGRSTVTTLPDARAEFAVICQLNGLARRSVAGLNAYRDYLKGIRHRQGTSFQIGAKS